MKQQGSFAHALVVILGMILWVATITSASALSSGDRIQVTSANGVSVRQSAGGTPYASGQTLGALGITTSGPQFAQINASGTVYEWWYVDFDSGQDGWVATVGYSAIVPAPPTLIYPGDGSSVPTIPTLSPTFSWNAVRGATGYGLYVEDASTGLFPVDQDVGNTASFTPPAGTLQPGKSYIWNMRASDSAGYSAYSTGSSGRFYFQTPSAPIVQTLAASLVTANSATLNCSVDPNGASTTIHFDSGLSPNPTYHFRIVAASSGGTVNGDDSTFMTSLPADSGVFIVPLSLTFSSSPRSVVDLQVFYTPAAQAEAGGEASLLDEIAAAVDESNNAYVNSQINHRLRLLGVELINYTEAAYIPGDPASGIGTDIVRLANTSDGYLDSVHTRRNQVGADIVALIESPSGSDPKGGISKTMTTVSLSFESDAFCVVRRTVMIGTGFGLPHEIG